MRSNFLQVLAVVIGTLAASLAAQQPQGGAPQGHGGGRGGRGGALDLPAAQ